MPGRASNRPRNGNGQIPARFGSCSETWTRKLGHGGQEWFQWAAGECPLLSVRLFKKWWIRPRINDSPSALARCSHWWVSPFPMIMNGQRSGSIWTGKLSVYRARTIISGLNRDKWSELIFVLDNYYTYQRVSALTKPNTAKWTRREAHRLYWIITTVGIGLCWL